MNKAQLAEARENLANKRTFSNSAEAAYALQNLNTILIPVMKTIGKGVAKKIGNKSGQHQNYGRTESGPLGKTFNAFALTNKPKKAPKSRPSRGPLGRTFNAMALGKDNKYGKD